MSPQETELLATVFVLYLLNCCHVVKRGITCVVDGSTVQMRSADSRGIIVFGNLLPWRGWISQCASSQNRSTAQLRSARRRWRLFQRYQGLLAQLGALEAFLILVLVPTSVALGFFRAIWPIIVGEILLLHTAILFSFHWTHRKVFAGEFVAERHEALVSMAVYPIATARAVDALARHIFHDVSAPCAASIAMRKADLASYLRKTFFDTERQKIRLPAGFSEEHYKAAMQPPEREIFSQSFCPRCHTQFVHREGACEECQAQLVAFPLKD